MLRAAAQPLTALPVAGPQAGQPRHATRRCASAWPAGTDPPGILIGKVAVALRYRVGDQAADTFNVAVHACTTRHQFLRLIRATVGAR